MSLDQAALSKGLHLSDPSRLIPIHPLPQTRHDLQEVHCHFSVYFVC